MEQGGIVGEVDVEEGQGAGLASVVVNKGGWAGGRMLGLLPRRKR